MFLNTKLGPRKEYTRNVFHLIWDTMVSCWWSQVTQSGCCHTPSVMDFLGCRRTCTIFVMSISWIQCWGTARMSEKQSMLVLWFGSFSRKKVWARRSIMFSNGLHGSSIGHVQQCRIKDSCWLVLKAWMQTRGNSSSWNVNWQKLQHFVEPRVLAPHGKIGHQSHWNS